MKSLFVFFVVAVVAQTNVVHTNVNFNFRGLVNGPAEKEIKVPEIQPDEPEEFTLVTEMYPYTSDVQEQDYVGYLAYQERNTLAARPAVIVVPDFLNLEIQHEEYARQFAEMGFISFVADLYGNGQTFDRTNREQITIATGLSRDLRAHSANEYMATLISLMAAVKADPRVDSTRVAVVGIGFGAAYAFDYVRYQGSAQDIKGVAGFHPDTLASFLSDGVSLSYGTPFMLNYGLSFPGITGADFDNFKAELLRSGSEGFFQAALGVTGCFSDPEAHSLVEAAPDIFQPATCAYNAPTSTRTWLATKDWINEQLTRRR